jgi:2-keto-4-pentenoate hydratase
MRTLIEAPRPVSGIVNDTGFLYTIPQYFIASDPVQLQSPTPSSSDVAGIAEQFVRARLTAQALSEYPGVVPADLETAYRCQELALARWPDQIGGWKVARIGPAYQDRYAEERLIGPVFTPNVHVAGTGRIIDCPVFDGGFAAVEAELVICVGRDAPADKYEWTLDEAAGYVGELCIGIEIASSPLATLNDLGPGAVVSDFGNNWGIVIGTAVEDWSGIYEVTAQSYIDDEFVGRGVTSVRHGPLGALAFTLATSAKRGRPLRAGAMITTGMITGVHDIRPGQRSRHVFQGLGEIGCRAVRATAHPSIHAKRA